MSELLFSKEQYLKEFEKGDRILKELQADIKKKAQLIQQNKNINMIVTEINGQFKMIKTQEYILQEYKSWFQIKAYTFEVTEKQAAFYIQKINNFQQEVDQIKIENNQIEKQNVKQEKTRTVSSVSNDSVVLTKSDKIQPLIDQETLRQQKEYEGKKAKEDKIAQQQEIKKYKLQQTANQAYQFKEKLKTNDKDIDKVNQYLEIMNKNEKIIGEGLDDQLNVIDEIEPIFDSINNDQQKLIKKVNHLTISIKNSNEIVLAGIILIEFTIVSTLLLFYKCD